MLTIDSFFGEGHSEAHPQLVAEFIRSQALDYHTTAMTAALYSLGDTIKQAAGEVVQALDERAPTRTASNAKPKRCF